MRTSFTPNREFYTKIALSRGLEKVESKGSTELFLGSTPEKIVAMGFSGKKAKYDFYISFRKVEDREKYISDWYARLESWENIKVARKTERTKPHTLKEGDILYSSWGYEQTNINFYQVTKVISDRTVEIREIKSKILDSSSYGTDTVIALKNDFLTPRGEYDKRGLTMIKRPSANNTIGLSNYESAWVWDGKPCQETSVGWGH